MKVTIQECSAEEEEEVIIRCRGIDERISRLLPDKGLVDVEISGHQFVVGVGLETHSHKIVFSL